MLQIDTVLCPVDFSPLSEREMALGIDVARALDAKLILHHNLDGPPPEAMGVSWMWEEGHREGERQKDKVAEERFRAMVEKAAESVPAEGRMSRGTLEEALLRTTEETGADLLVMGTHGRSTKEHHSATLDVLVKASCPILTLRDHAADTSVFKKRREAEDSEERDAEVLVPIDFADYSRAAARFAFHLAEVLPLRIHLLHVLHERRRGLGWRRSADPEPEELHARRQEMERLLWDLVPEAHRERSDCSVTDGKIGEEILAVTDRIRPSLVVMGTHRKGFFRKVLEGAHSQELLYGSGCPVLFVPANVRVPEAAVTA